MEGVSTIRNIWRGSKEESFSRSKAAPKKSRAAGSEMPASSSRKREAAAVEPQRCHPYRICDLMGSDDDNPDLVAVSDTGNVDDVDSGNEANDSDCESRDAKDKDSTGDDDSDPDPERKDLRFDEDENDIDMALDLIGQQQVVEEPDDAPALAVVPGEEEDVMHALDLGFVSKRPGVAEIRFRCPEGELRYNIMGEFMRAHCTVHADCTRQRTVKASAGATTKKAKGQGRCVGALVAWLKQGEGIVAKEDHMKMPTASFELRASARRRFLELDGANEFTEWERKVRDGEDQEPKDIR